MADNKQDDEILGKAYDSKLMKRLLTYIKPYKKYVIIAILLNIFVASLGPESPGRIGYCVQTERKEKRR